jgi:hypothetical protein
LAHASHLLKFSGDRRPYLVNLRDPRRHATSERRFFASSSSSSLRPMFPPPRPIDELPDMVLARAAPICAWRGEVLRSVARNCDGGAEKGRGMRRGGDRFWTRIDSIDRYISRSMRAGWVRLQPR